MKDAYWLRKITEYKAVKYKAHDEQADKVIWFETENFGWILSAADEKGNRRLLVEY